MTENRSDDDRPVWATDPQASSTGGVHETVAFGAPDLDGPQPHGAVPAEHSKAARRITRGGAVGLVAAGLLAGGLGVAALASTSRSSTASSPDAATMAPRAVPSAGQQWRADLAAAWHRAVSPGRCTPLPARHPAAAGLARAFVPETRAGCRT